MAPARSRGPAPPTRHPLGGGLGAGLVLLATACSHPWDDYQAFEPSGEGGAGGSTGEGGSAAICAELCPRYVSDGCEPSWVACATDCATQLALCTSEQRTQVAQCTPSLAVCQLDGSSATFQACLSFAASCFDVP